MITKFKLYSTKLNSFVENKIFESSYVSNRTSEITSTFPLYIYTETTGQQAIGQTTERTPNLNTEIVKQIAEKLSLTFTNEKEQIEKEKENLFKSAKKASLLIGSHANLFKGSLLVG